MQPGDVVVFDGVESVAVERLRNLQGTAMRGLSGFVVLLTVRRICGQIPNTR